MQRKLPDKSWLRPQGALFAARGLLVIALTAGAASAGCAAEVRADDPELAYLGEHLVHRGRLFSGVLITPLPAVDVVRRTPFRNGLAEGVESERYGNGSLAALREYRAGRKTGVHRGWFPNGRPSYRYEYASNQFHGDYWEWHASGALYAYARYDNGQPIGRKVWREDGTIYMNYVFAAGAAYGLPGAKLCRQVRADESDRTTSL
jgi:hypothetical protein